ncbi:MAG: MMPL family transporter [Planctomycetia bacterium]|nr:MMPL family transporter [Planctomycetia bacterium]
MYQFLGRLAANHPWKIVAAWVTLAATLFLTAPRWESEAHDEDIRFLPERCASLRGYHLLGEAFPQELDCSRITFCLERNDAPLSQQDFALASQVVADLDKLRQTEPQLKIVKVYSFQDPMLGKRLTSADGHCTLIQVSLATPYLAIQTQVAVDRAETAVKQRLDQAGFPPPQLLTTGAAGIGRDLIRAGGNSLESTTLATVVLVVVILLFVYRAPLLALIPLATIALSVFVALRLLAVFTQIPGVHLVNVSQIFTIVLLYGAGTDYCLFLISRYREELEEGQEGPHAVRRSVVSVGAALAASAGTVICGLSLMGFAEFAKVRCAGPAIAIALAVALAASLTLTPALLRIFGAAAFWPKRVRPTNAMPRFAWEGAAAPDHTLWERISRLVVARPLLIWCVSVLLLLPFTILGLCTTAICKPTGELSPNSASVRGMEAIQRHFTAGETGPITILLSAAADWNSPEGRQLIGQLSQELAKLDNVAEVRSLTQPLGKPLPQLPTEKKGNLLGGLLKGLGRDLGQAMQQADRSAREHYLAAVTADGVPKYIARLDVVLRSDPFDPASTATLEQMEAWFASALPESKVPMGWVTADYYGVTVYSRDMAAVTQSDRFRVNILVLGGIFLILLALIRHFWVVTYLLGTVLLSYFATLGATALVGWWWAGYPLGQMDWRVPFFLFTILAAVGEDYNILLVSRILEERKLRGNREGIRHGLSRTGATITACGLIMAGTFATLVLGGLNTLVQIGFALAFGVLLDTFLVRPFLVPAFLLLVWKDKEPVQEEKPQLEFRYRKSA